MAIIQTCCGCCGVRKGSTASAIYSIIIAVLGFLNFGYGLATIPTYRQMLYDQKEEHPEFFNDLDIDTYVNALMAEYIYALFFLVFLLIASVLVSYAIEKNNKELLIPFLIAKCLGFVYYMYAGGLAIYYVAQVGTAIAGATVIVVLVLLLPFFIADIVCFLCVLSQYQEYRDGRGRLNDTTVVIQQAAPVATGGFNYRQMEDDAPPAYGAPPTTKSVNQI